MVILKNKLLGLFTFLFGIFFLYILTILCFFSDVDFARKQYTLLFHFSWIPFFLILFGTLFLFLLYKFCQYISNKLSKGLFLIISFIIFLFQLFCIYNYYFFTDWDVSTIIDAAFQIATKANFTYVDYFSTYPNNMLLVYFYSLIIRIANFIGLGEHYYFSIIAIQAMLSWITGLMVYYVARKISNSKATSLFAWLVFVLLIQFSPWISIPYSDGTGLILPILILAIYCSSFKKYYLLKWILIITISVIGYKIKPQIIIVTIAILIITFINLRIEKQYLNKYLKVIFSCIISLMLTNFVLNSCISSMNIEINSDKTFGITHFLMMGMNPVDRGVWSEQDVEISQEESTAEKRMEKNIKETKSRISQMGITGVFDQIRYKTLTNFSDGTFCWGGEGIFYQRLRPDKIQGISEMIRSFYYNREYEDFGFKVFEIIVNLIWYGCLMASFIFVFRKNKANLQYIIMLSIIGLTLFETIFEARARYFFIYAPFFILLASCSIGSINSKCKTYLYKIKGGTL